MATAVRQDRPWPLRFAGVVVREVRARALWERIMRATHAYAEPGVIFISTSLPSRWTQMVVSLPILRSPMT